MVCAEIWNVNNNWEKNPDGFSPDSWMPGARSDAQDFDELLEEIQQNRIKCPDQEELEVFKRRSSFLVTTPRSEVMLKPRGSHSKD